MVTVIITTTVFLLLILLVRGIFQKKISGMLQYSLWLLAALKLLIFPVPVVESNLSVMNLFEFVTLNENLEMATMEDEGQTADKNVWDDVENSDLAQMEKGYEAIEGTGESSGQYPGNQLQMGEQQENQEQNNIEQAADEEPAKHSFWEKVNQPQIWETLYKIWAAGSFLIFLYILVLNGRLYVSLKKKRILFEKRKSHLPVYLVEELPTPCLHGRAIYIPAELAGQDEKLHHVLVHENTHYKHGDGLWGIVRGICVAVYWWHPLVWLCAYLSMQDCEYACDEAVIRQLGETQRISYGKTILSLTKIQESRKGYFSMASLLSGGGRKMKKRITRIADRGKSLAAAGALVVILLVLGLAVTVTSGKNHDGSENFAGDGSTETEHLSGESSEQVAESTEQGIPSDGEEQTVLSENIEVMSEIQRKENSRFGWSISAENQLLHQNPDTGKMEVAVELMDYVSEEEYVDCSFVDEDTAYIAYFSKEKQLVVLQYTIDGAKSWNKTILTEQLELGVGGIFLSFADETTGYLLVGSEPGAGMMEQTLYVTKDGGKTLEKVGEPDMRNHPTDLLFVTEEIGFMTTKYYGEDPYLYQTKDGGEIWNPVSVEMSEGLEFSYVNGYSLEMKEGSAEEVSLILEGVGVDEKVYLEYVTKDAGKNWELLENMGAYTVNEDGTYICRNLSYLV